MTFFITSQTPGSLWQEFLAVRWRIGIMPAMKSRLPVPAPRSLLRRSASVFAWAGSALVVGGLLAGCGPKLDHLSIRNPTGPIPLGTTAQLVGVATFSDGVDHYLQTDFLWTSDNPSVAAVGASLGEQGLVTGRSKGTTNIRIAMAGLNAALPVQIVDPVLKLMALRPIQATLKVGGTQQFTAERFYTDGTTEERTATASWSSSDPAIATVSGGLATAVAPGTVAITATADQITARATLTID